MAVSSAPIRPNFEAVWSAYVPIATQAVYQKCRTEIRRNTTLYESYALNIFGVSCIYRQRHRFATPILVVQNGLEIPQDKACGDLRMAVYYIFVVQVV